MFHNTYLIHKKIPTFNINEYYASLSSYNSTEKKNKSFAFSFYFQALTLECLVECFTDDVNLLKKRFSRGFLTYFIIQKKKSK